MQKQKPKPNLDLQHVRELKQSLRRAGELPIPALRNQNGETIDGRHRKEAGFKLWVTVRTKDRLDFLMKRQATMVQRRASEAEQIEILSEMCREVERKFPRMAKDKIGQYVVKNVTSLSRPYAYRLIPDEYLGKSRGRPSVSDDSLLGDYSRSDEGIETIDGTVIKTQSTSSSSQTSFVPVMITCLKCGTRQAQNPITHEVLYLIEEPVKKDGA